MKTYQEYLTETSNIEKLPLNNRKPVYYGSAIFPVIETPQLSTNILFMGYWMVKKKINEVGLLMTLREQNGRIIYRDSIQITSPKSVEISISELLKGFTSKDENFNGSIELEIFSARDLVFPYPAFVVNYYNNYSSAVVHTTGRVYKEIEYIENKNSIVKEAGFDLLPDEGVNSFFSFVNGIKKEEDITLDIEIINSDGVHYHNQIDIATVNPFEMKMIILNDFFDLHQMLNNKPGTIKIKHSFTSFFPRFIAGNFKKDNMAIGITHTFYDNSDNNNKSAYWENINEEIFYDSAIFIPIFILDDYYTQLQFYPIYSPSDHLIDLTFFSEVGEKLLCLKGVESFVSYKSEFKSIDIKSLLTKYPNIIDKAKGLLITKSWETKNKIPTRLKYGLNIGLNNGKLDIPTNICFASNPPNKTILKKTGTFKWFPLIGKSNSIGIIDNASFVKNYDKVAECLITFYSKDDGLTLNKKVSIEPYGQYLIKYDNELKKVFCDETIWVTVKSTNPFINAWYFTFNESGVVGGDHSF